MTTLVTPSDGIAYAPSALDSQNVACRGHLHGINGQYGTNNCCLAPLISQSQERTDAQIMSIPNERECLSSTASMRMCGTMQASGQIIRPGRFCSKPLPLNRIRLNKMKSEMVPRDLRWDPVHEHGASDIGLRLQQAEPPSETLSLDSEKELLKRVDNMHKSRVSDVEFDDWLPVDERMALRRFITQKGGHARERLGHRAGHVFTKARQWWQVSETKSELDSKVDSDLDSDIDSDLDPENSSGVNNTAGEGAEKTGGEAHSGVTEVEWAACGKVMRCMTADPIQLSPREKFYGKKYTSGGGMYLSALAYSWLRHENTCIVGIDAGKKDLRRCNILEVIIQKQEHAFRFRGQTEAAQRWKKEYDDITRNNNAIFLENHYKRRRIDLLRHMKEVGLENELRRGGFDADHGLFDGERELINSKFTALKIKDLEWTRLGDIPTELDQANVPATLPPLSPERVTDSDSLAGMSEAPTPGGGKIIRSKPAKENEINDVDKACRKYWDLRERASAQVSSRQAEAWHVKERIDALHKEGHTVARLLHDVYARTEFLTVMETRIGFIVDALFEDRRKIEVSGPVDDFGDVWARGRVVFKRLPLPNELDGVEPFRAKDLIFLRDKASVTKSSRKKLKTWCVYLFVCFGLVIREVDLDDPVILNILNFDDSHMSRRQRYRGCPKPSKAHFAIAKKVYTKIFGNRQGNKKRVWFSKKKIQLQSQATAEELNVLNFFENHFRLFKPQDFRRGESKVVEKLLKWHLCMCGGTTTPNRWLPSKERDGLERVVEGMYTWLGSVSLYLKKAAPYWSALNSRIPLQASLVKLEARAHMAESHQQEIKASRESAMSHMRDASHKYAEAHERQHLNKHGGKALWYRRLPGAPGSEKFYPEMNVRDGNYRFPIPKIWSEPLRHQLQIKMDELYRKEAAPWYMHDSHPHEGDSYGNLYHEDHPHRLFQAEKQREIDEAKEREKVAARHEKKMMQRLLKKSTDKELDDMLHEDHGPHWMDHHIKNVNHGMRHESLKTVWKWTWTSHTYPLDGMTRHCLLTAGGKPVDVPLAPCAPN